MFSAAGFNQYGLYHDDALYENADVKEALARAPQVSQTSFGVSNIPYNIVQ